MKNKVEELKVFSREDFDVFLGDLYYRLSEEFDKFKAGVKNIIFYFDVIWNDRWFDYVFLLKIVERKFENMERNWDKAIYENSEIQKAEFKEIRELLNLIIEDELDGDELKKTEKRLFVLLSHYRKFWD